MIDDKNKKIDKQTGDKKLIQEFSANKSDTSKLISKLETCTSLIQVFDNRDVKIETKGKLKAEIMDKFDYAKLGEMINTSIDNAITNKVVPMIEKINDRIDILEADNKFIKSKIEILEEDNKFIKSKIEVIENEIVVIKTDIQKIKECPTIKKELAE